MHHVRDVQVHFFCELDHSRSLPKKCEPWSLTFVNFYLVKIWATITHIHGKVHCVNQKCAWFFSKNEMKDFFVKIWKKEIVDNGLFDSNSGLFESNYVPLPYTFVNLNFSSPKIWVKFTHTNFSSQKIWANNEPRSWVNGWTRRSRSRFYISELKVGCLWWMMEKIHKFIMLKKSKQKMTQKIFAMLPAY